MAASVNPLFDPEDPVVVEIWDTIQRCQTDFALDLELIAYYASDQWNRAHTVLDAGTGNGYYLSRIATLFPHKQYRAVDICAEFLTKAARNYSGLPIEFRCHDLFDVIGSYDFVIMRLLLQHLDDLGAVLDKVQP